jgi:hypothetical protein
MITESIFVEKNIVFFFLFNIKQWFYHISILLTNIIFIDFI